MNRVITVFLFLFFINSLSARELNFECIDDTDIWTPVTANLTLTIDDERYDVGYIDMVVTLYKEMEFHGELFMNQGEPSFHGQSEYQGKPLRFSGWITEYDLKITGITIFAGKYLPGIFLECSEII